MNAIRDEDRRQFIPCEQALDDVVMPGQQVWHTIAEVGADGIVREPGKSNFAGSSLTMDSAVENVRVFLGWPEQDAMAACSAGVAAALGL